MLLSLLYYLALNLAFVEAICFPSSFAVDDLLNLFRRSLDYAEKRHQEHRLSNVGIQTHWHQGILLKIPFHQNIGLVIA